MKKIKIAITDFAQPLAMSGSIRREGMISGLELGAKAHKRIQTALARNLSYKSEMLIKEEFKTKRFCFSLSGRADGVMFGEKALVDEIKSTFSLERLIEEIETFPQHPYRLQALTYAYILSLKSGNPVGAQLRLVSLKNKKEHLVHLDLTDDFSIWFAARLQQLEDEERLRIAQRRKRRGIASTIKFPFAPPRPHQSDLADTVEQVAKQGARALIQAPTGIGKTMGVLFPILKSGFKRGNITFYLAPKNSQFEVAKDAVERICPGKAVKARTLTSKRKLCRKEFVDCHPDYCEYAKDYYDKMNAGRVYEEVKKFGHCGASEFIALGEQHQVCPYQLQMDTLASADLIIGDYNYVFSPNAGLSGLFTDLEKSRKPNLIVDEVHNLYARGMEYYSPTLSLSFYDDISRFSPPKKIKKAFFRLVSESRSLIEKYRPNRGNSEEVAIEGDLFLLYYEQIHAMLLDYISVTPHLTDNDPILELYRMWASFCDVLRIRADETKVAYIIKSGYEYLQLICCDPSRYLATTMEHFHTVTGFSATLKPFEFYRHLSGFPVTSITKEFPSGFPDEHRKVLIIPQVSTTYRNRDQNYIKIAEAITRIAKEHKGNYLVFFPSYDFLAKTREALEKYDLPLVIQKRDCGPADIKELEAQLTSPKTKSLVLTVQGGVLSEGVDFNSPHLKGAFIIGPAVPLVTFERELLRGYFQEKFGDGFSYAYAWPAMTKSIQASGRVIRDTEKRGLIVLMDDRFLQEPYAQSLPEFWYEKTPRELVSKSVLSDVRDFWQAPTNECEA
jgi:DNA excision repair protein ERCC-2